MSGAQFVPRDPVPANVTDCLRSHLQHEEPTVNYRPIGLSHSADCDSGEWEWLCDECRAEASRDWIIPDRGD